MHAWHEKNKLEQDFQFDLIISTKTEFPAHWHEEFEIIYQIDGELQVGLNNENYILRPRDILLINKGDIHCFPCQRVETKEAFVQFGFSFFDSSLHSIGNRRFIKPFLSCTKDSEDKGTAINLENNILHLLEEYNNQTEGYRIAIKSLLYKIALTIVRDVKMENYSHFEKSSRLKKLERLDNVFKFVEANYNDKISLQEIADVAHYSKYHFTRFFREATGMSFNCYLNNYRIRKAEQLLLESDNQIVDVALKCGFNCIESFNRTFKELMGCSPREYRKIIKTK